jgi:hypothetical protein
VVDDQVVKLIGAVTLLVLVIVLAEIRRNNRRK